MTEPFTFYFARAEFSDDEIVQLLVHVSTVYECLGGSPLEIVGGDVYEPRPGKQVVSLRLQPECDHNEMVETCDPQYAWKCAKCGYVYGKED